MTKNANKLLYFIALSTILITAIIASVLMGIRLQFPTKYSEDVNLCCDKYGLNKALVFACIKAESGFDENAISSVGAIGLMQIMPSTGEYIARQLLIQEYNLYEPQTNIEFGCFYLKYLFKKFVDKNLVLFAYNAGEGELGRAIKEYGSYDEAISNYVSVDRYIKVVLKYESMYNKFV